MDEYKNINDILKNIDYEQVKPFTFDKMFGGLVSIRIFGNSAIYYSKETKNCLGISDKSTINFFQEI